jgi:hypothetical protein
MRRKEERARMNTATRIMSNSRYSYKLSFNTSDLRKLTSLFLKQVLSQKPGFKWWWTSYLIIHVMWQCLYAHNGATPLPLMLLF